MKKLSYVLILSLALVACNEKAEKGTNEVQAEEVVEDKKELMVEFDFKTSVEDQFKILLNNIEVDDLQKKNINVVETVAPTDFTEKITANFGENISNSLQINLGNASEKEVEVVGITVSYGKTSISASTFEDLNKYFVFNKYIVSDSTTTKLTVNKVDGKLFPMIVARRRLINALKN